MITVTAEDFAEAKAGRFTAVFATSADAQAFYERLSGEPAGFYARSIRRNRANGRVVMWERDREVPDELGRPGWEVYWTDMCETVGYYGSTFGEPPFGTGKRTAYLNGRAGPASM